MNWVDFLIQIVSSFVATVGFALIFGVPRKQFWVCGLVATAGWALYYVLDFLGLSPSISTFLATVVVMFLSRIFAVVRRTPVTVFVTTGIFPVIPGGGIYWTAYYLVINDTATAFDKGFTAIKCVIAIVLGIVLVREIPGPFFKKFERKK